MASRLPSDCGDERGRQSPGLELLLDAVKASFPMLPSSDQHSLRKVVRVITGAFATSLSHWTVGVGLEEQLQGTLLYCDPRGISIARVVSSLAETGMLKHEALN